MSGLPPPNFDLEKTKRSLRDGYVHYVCGRAIKANIYSSNDVIRGIMIGIIKKDHSKKLLTV